MSDTIILCAGKIKYLHLPISSSTSNAMVPVNGKPAIAWILEDLIQRGIIEVVLVMRAEDQKLRAYLESVFDKQMDITKVIIKDSSSILHSLKAGLEVCNGDSLRVILGDTLIQDDIEVNEDFIYINEATDSHRWCLVITDETGKVIDYRDKEFHVPKPHLAVCGFYAFTQLGIVKEDLESCISEDKKQLSDLLREYQKSYPIKSRMANHWYDFGNIDNLIRAKQQLLQSRYFNSLSVDPVLNTITKMSEFDDKLRKELAWYEELPEELQVLCPRIISKKEVDGKLYLKQEYYGYPTLAELFMFSDLDVDHLESIIHRLLEIHQKFKSYPGVITREDAAKVYHDKTWSRLNEMKHNEDQWNYWINEAQDLIVNGQTIKGISILKPWIEEKIEELTETVSGSIIHGDYCFSNILFDLNSQIARLIDPRGSFGRSGIYGDPRYDIAKFRHSLVGKYDYIVSDQFQILNDAEGIHFHIHSNPYHEYLKQMFDEKIREIGYKPEEIQFIEGLLFLSMLPLHKDKPERQKAMFITGLKQLNKLYANSY